MSTTTRNSCIHNLLKLLLKDDCVVVESVILSPNKVKILQDEGYTVEITPISTIVRKAEDKPMDTIDIYKVINEMGTNDRSELLRDLARAGNMRVVEHADFSTLTSCMPNTRLNRIRLIKMITAQGGVSLKEAKTIAAEFCDWVTYNPVKDNKASPQHNRTRFTAKHYSPRMNHAGHWAVDGPGDGLGYHAGYLNEHLNCASKDEAARAATIADIAYGMGKASLQEEFRKLMNIARPQRQALRANKSEQVVGQKTLNTRATGSR